MRSNTCKGANNQFLEEYHSKSAADIAAKELKQQYGKDLMAYQCTGCGYWHLKGEVKRRQCHFCTDRNLFLKDIYPTREEAQQVAAWLQKEKRVQLVPYKCPHGSGWHLTKRG